MADRTDLAAFELARQRLTPTPAAKPVSAAPPSAAPIPSDLLEILRIVQAGTVNLLLAGCMKAQS